MASNEEKNSAIFNDSSTVVTIEDYDDHLEGNDKTKEATDIESKEIDIWAINYDVDEGLVKWKDLSTKEKAKATLTNLFKVVLVIGFLYIFICSISMLSDAFQILAGKSAGEIFANDSFLSNPISGLILGILVTVLVQSSSTSTTIVTTMVAASILSVETAIPIIMGTNIGTSVTNTLVSLTQSMERDNFRKAFAGATVHDVFNLLSVLIILPLEEATHYLYHLTKAIIDSFNIQGGADAPDLLKVLTDPVIKGIVQVNKTVITLVAQEIEIESNYSMIKIWCEQRKGYITVNNLYNQTVTVDPGNGTAVTDVVPMTTYFEQEVTVGVKKCTSPDDFLFANTGLSDVESGIILLVVALFLMCVCLYLMVKILGTLLRGSVASIIKKVINSSFKSPFGWVTGYLAMLVGAALTFLVQSSSVFTSTITPLVGIGVISLKRMYPLTLGANIGTTTTSLLAALASDGSGLVYSLQIALVHLFFNISGIILWYPVPFMRKIPIKGAKALGNTTAKYRWFAVLYIICVFFLIPLAILGLSLAGFWPVISVVIFALVLAAFITVVTILQNRKPNWLPKILRTWKFLPIWLRSLQPYDKFMSKYLMCKCCCKSKNEEEVESVSSCHQSSVTAEGSVNKAFAEEKSTTRL